MFGDIESTITIYLYINGIFLAYTVSMGFEGRFVSAIVSEKCELKVCQICVADEIAVSFSAFQI